MTTFSATFVSERTSEEIVGMTPVVNVTCPGSASMP